MLSLGWGLATVFGVAAMPAFLAGLAMLAKGGVRRAVPAAIPAAAE